MAGQTAYIRPGAHSVNAQVFVPDVAQAIAFYREAFGAREAHRLAEPDGRVVHAGIVVGDSPIELAPASQGEHSQSAAAPGEPKMALGLYVEDVDAVVSRAMAAGATLLIPVSNQFYGDRSGRLADPFGHVWIVSTHLEDVSAEEMQRRFDAMIER